MNDAADHAVPLQATQLLDEHLLRYARNRALQFAKPECPVTEQVKKNDQLPAPLKHFQSLFDTRRRNVGCDARIRTFLFVSHFCVRSSHPATLADIQKASETGKVRLAS